MKHLQKYEDFNVQDVMAYHTSLTKLNDRDMMSTPTSVIKTDDEIITLLKPFYDFMITITEISDLTEITHEELDEYVGFSFIVYYMKVMILSDKDKVFMLIDGDLIPINEPKDILDIIEKEK